MKVCEIVWSKERNRNRMKNKDSNRGNGWLKEKEREIKLIVKDKDIEQVIEGERERVKKE